MTGNIISVIIPARNAEETIEESLRALFASTLPPREVILINDGCTDRTIEIAGRFPLRIEKSHAPGGVAAARNTGAALSTSPVLFFVDADVVLEPGALLAASKAMARSDIAAAIGLQSTRSAFPNRASIYKNLWLHHTYKTRADKVSVIYSSAVAIRRDAFEGVGGFDVHYRRPNIEDSELGKRITEAGYRLAVEPEIEFLHIKRYTVAGMVKTDFLRTVGMTKVQLRDRFRRIRRENYSSIPTSFLLSCLTPWLALPLLAARLPLGSLWLVPILSILLNHRWLRSLAGREGSASLLWGAFFLMLDIVAVNLGILWGTIEFLSGRRY